MDWFWIIVGMALVTYIPRVLPAALIGQRNVSPWMARWLESIPYAALGALIFPGILSVEQGEPAVGIIGGAVAAIFALFRLNMLIVIVGAIGAVILVKAMIG